MACRGNWADTSLANSDFFIFSAVRARVDELLYDSIFDERQSLPTHAFPVERSASLQRVRYVIPDIDVRCRTVAYRCDC